MRNDDLAEPIRRRIVEFRRGGDREVLVAGDAHAEVDALLHSVSPADEENPSPEERERMAGALRMAGTLFFLRFDSVPPPDGDLNDLAYALMFYWLVRDPPELPPLLRALLPGPDSDVTSQVGAAVALLRRVKTDRDAVNVRITLVLFEAVVAATPPTDKEFSLRMGCLVDAELTYCRGTGDLRAADDAIDRARQCLDVLPARHPDRGWFLAAIAFAKAIRHEHGDMGALKDVIDFGEQALGSRERTVRLRGVRRRATGHPFLDMLADIAYTYELSPFRTLLQVELSGAYVHRYRLSRVPGDLDRAIALREQASVAAGSKDPNLLMGIVDGCLARLDRTGDLDDLRRAVAVAERFMVVADADHPNRDLATALVAVAPLLPDLKPVPPPPKAGGGHLKRLWLDQLAPRFYGAPETIDVAIILGEQALYQPGVIFALDETKLAPHKDDPATARVLVLMCQLYTSRFEQWGHKPDIDLAISLVNQVDTVEYVDDLIVAARAYRARFGAARTREDLDEAIALFEKAFELRARDHPGWPRLTRDLAGMYGAKARDTGDTEFLRRGAELSEQLLAADPTSVLAIDAVADTHVERFAVSGEPEDLSRAIDLYLRAAAAEWSPQKAARLGNAYQWRFEVSGDPADLRLAIATYGAVLATSPLDDALRTTCAAGYCSAFRHLFEVAPDEVSADRLAVLVELCTQPMRGLPRHEAAARFSVGSLARVMNQPDTAVRVLDQAVDLLRTAAWRDISWPEQEAAMGQFQELASEAIAAHLAAGDPDGAVEVAERSRALVLGTELDLRADLADLATVFPELATRFERVRDRLTTPDLVDLVGETHDTVGRNNRVQLWAEHDDLVAHIRMLPRFAEFRQPPRLDALRPDTGAVVLVSATASGGSAVIVTPDAAPVAIRLPRLTTADLAAHAEALIEVTSAPPLTQALWAPRVMTEVLGWLWESAVRRVLSAVPGPRIWWLPIGLLGLFPLHAAAVPGRPGALDLAVSSYIPTLRALQHARRRARPAVRTQLTVAMEHTSGFPDLPGTAAEAAALLAEQPGHRILTGTDATADTVRAALADCTWAHFACHASADPTTSSRAALHLHGGELPVETISRLRMDAAELAYLSACSTAARGVGTDEPTNLASAFHLAGFRHVVASLWPLADNAAADAARAFYRTLGDTADDTAQAVNAVARELRTAHPDRPNVWAALIHSGP